MGPSGVIGCCFCCCGISANELNGGNPRCCCCCECWCSPDLAALRPAAIVATVAEIPCTLSFREGISFRFRSWGGAASRGLLAAVEVLKEPLYELRVVEAVRSR